MRRPPAGEADLGQVPDDVVAALTGRGDAGILEHREELAAGGRAAAGEFGAREIRRPVQGVLVQVELALPGGGRGEGARGGELQHPAQVLRCHEVEGAAHRPGAHHGAAGQFGENLIAGAAGRAHAQRPQALPEVLRLHGEQVSHEVGDPGFSCGSRGDALAGQPQPQQVGRVDLGGLTADLLGCHSPSIAAPSDTLNPSAPAPFHELARFKEIRYFGAAASGHPGRSDAKTP